MDRSGDPSGDASGDPSADARWLSYDELAKLRRISRASAERLVFRRHWRRQRGNDHVVRALVPPEFLSGDASPDPSAGASPDPSPDASPDPSPDANGLLAGALAALEDAVAALREQLGAANGRADRAEQGREAAIALVDQAMAALADSNARTDRAEAETRELRDRIDVLQTQLGQAQAAVQGADELRAADDTRRAMSRWARAWGAWRGR